MSIFSKNSNTLIIIAGVSGEIGSGYADIFLEKGYKVIGISRKRVYKTTHKSYTYLLCDLTNPEKVETLIGKLDIKNVNKIVFIHSIGVDKFEMQSYPEITPLKTIDEKVYNSNVNTYKYIAYGLINHIKILRATGLKINLVLSGIGSVADKHDLIFLTSFSESKNVVRYYIRNAVDKHDWIRGKFINVSSTSTKSALDVRLYADTTYFLTPEEVAKRSYTAVIDTKKGYSEIDIIKKDPNFSPDYYDNRDRIYARWSKFVRGQ
jgi:short-subunit dehydrogenase